MPLFELSFPALKRRPIQNIEHILATIDQLILADGRVEVFEYLLSKLIRMHLEESLRPAAVRTSADLFQSTGDTSRITSKLHRRRVSQILALP